MKIKIIKCSCSSSSYWYSDQIGSIFNVVEGSSADYFNMAGDTGYGLSLRKDDCEIVSEEHPEGTFKVQIIQYKGSSRIWYKGRIGEIYLVKEGYDDNHSRNVYFVVEPSEGFYQYAPTGGDNRFQGLPLEKDDCIIIKEESKNPDQLKGRYRIIMEEEAKECKSE